MYEREESAGAIRRKKMRSRSICGKPVPQREASPGAGRGKRRNERGNRMVTSEKVGAWVTHDYRGCIRRQRPEGGFATAIRGKKGERESSIGQSCHLAKGGRFCE